MDVPLIFSRQIYRKSYKYSPSKARGFTLIELLVTLSIASIILSYGVPKFQSLVKVNDNAVTINKLVSDLAYSRSEALKRIHDVVVCKSNDGATCNNKSEWQDGWIIFVDEIRSDRQRGPNEPLLRVQQALGNNIKIVFSTFNNKNRIVYRDSGNANYSQGTFRFCTNKEQYYKDLILSPIGRTRLEVHKGPIFLASDIC